MIIILYLCVVILIEALVQLEREHYILTEGEESEICAISSVSVETEICIGFKICMSEIIIIFNYFNTFLHFSLVKIIELKIGIKRKSCRIFLVEDNNILENPYTRPITLQSNDSRISIIGNGSITIRDNPSFGKYFSCYGVRKLCCYPRCIKPIGAQVLTQVCR